MHDDPMIDPLDREIARALAVDSSPEFVSRVRQRIAAEPEPEREREREYHGHRGGVAHHARDDVAGE